MKGKLKIVIAKCRVMADVVWGNGIKGLEFILTINTCKLACDSCAFADTHRRGSSISKLLNMEISPARPPAESL
jgi:hypothetical protein